MEVQSVQAIASLSLSTIASEFIRPEDEQPGITGAFLDVPVIDIGRGSESSDIVRQVSEASSEWGIFQIVNHGIPDDVISKMQRVGKEFFELSQEEEKQLVAQVPDSDNVEGYGTKYLKSAKASRGWVDHLFLRIWPPSAVNYHFWPENPPSFREANEEYAMRLNKVADKMFEYLSLGLGLERNAMKEAVGGDEQLAYLMKINYYPPCPRPDLVLGVGAHTDMCAITLLVPNEVQGLQVFRNERWYDVEYIPNALIVHTGDQVEILSNGKYKSVFHRTVVNKDETRMSWPVFLEPVLEQEIGPIPELINEDNPEKFKTKTYKDYVYCKLNKIPQ